MEISKLVLLAELPGLEAARVAIDKRIEEIRAALSSDESRGVGAIETPDVGGKPLGRIKQKRNLSPEQRENRRRLIAAARQKKLDKLRGKVAEPPSNAEGVPVRIEGPFGKDLKS